MYIFVTLMAIVMSSSPCVGIFTLLPLLLTHPIIPFLALSWIQCFGIAVLALLEC
ncbi:hypothetical protein BDZ97DRAFT_1811116 [Flammula alnicola]|nr:hypothetical protein BDZ97DRAFT_1811116 [Flammula alnicola]